MLFRTAPDIFRDRKIPKHLIIRDDNEIRKKPKFQLLKWVVWASLLAGSAYLIIAIQVQ